MQKLIAVAVAFAPSMARVTRSVALSVRKQDYISAAIARGERPSYIILREMLPNVVAPIIVEMTIRISFAVMLLCHLEFPRARSAAAGGRMGTDGLRSPPIYAPQRRHSDLAEPFAIAIVAVGFNLLGDGLRDALNPRTLRMAP